MPFRPFNPNAPVSRHYGNLPHWEQQGTTYFVTSRLADSLPGDVIDHWRALRDAWLNARGLASPEQLDRLGGEEKQAYHREFTARFHELLDAGHGACPLSDATCAAFLIRRLVEGHVSRYHLDAWVIMPNHFHALVEPEEDSDLGDIVQRWKGGSAREINLVRGISGKLWHREAFDHIVRSEAQLNHFRRYIAMNPSRAGLKAGCVLGIGAESGLSADAVLERYGLQPKQSTREL
ncbi:transposase [Prosthecobacter sp.]|uniref:transposase n=1 Tax=Prosthecobacter sp. TaxID=1965333 RepID=UPI0037851859